MAPRKIARATTGHRSSSSDSKRGVFSPAPSTRRDDEPRVVVNPGPISRSHPIEPATAREDETFELLIRQDLRSRPDGARDWQIEVIDEERPPWIRVRHRHHPPPDQGWKLHVSAGACSALTVLRAVLPVVRRLPSSFKVLASVAALKHLNEGGGGLAQVGKFITIYPQSEGEAVRLADALDEATRGLRGPTVLSDRALRPRGLVHYRYGAIGDQHVQLPTGQVVPAIQTPEGSLVPDVRLPRPVTPEWVTDPFAAAGLASEPETPPSYGRRYVNIAKLYESAKGAVHLAVDSVQPRLCVLKEARRDALLDEDGTDARDRLRHEAEVLTRLAGLAQVPCVLDVFEEADGLYLVLEDFAGVTLSQYVRSRTVRGVLPTMARIASWGRELATILASVHEAGFVHGDLKSSNVLIADNEGLRLIDFELAYDLSAPKPPRGFGTPGYLSPQRLAGQAPTVADDIYGIGALLYFMATGAEPSLAPTPMRLLDRPLTLLNPGVGADLRALVETCLDHDPTARPSLAMVRASLDAALPRASLTRGPRPSTAPAARSDTVVSHGALRAGQRVAERLCRYAEAIPVGSRGRTTPCARAPGVPSDLNTGVAGILMALAEFADAFGEEPYLRAVERLASWLLDHRPRTGATHPGLFVGEAGRALALLRAGQALGRDEFVDEAVRRGRWVADQPHRSPDLFNGSAGRLRMHVLIGHATSDRGQLEAAIECGRHLVSAAVVGADGNVTWPMPSGHGPMSGRPCHGYAHGAAGIADCLLDLLGAPDHHRFADCVIGAARWLMASAVVTLEDGSGLDWPPAPDEEHIGPYWCHGATGVGRFFLRAGQLGVVRDAYTIAERAAATVGRGGRWIGPSRCHGLAGNIDFLMDVTSCLDDKMCTDDVLALARLLEPFVNALGDETAYAPRTDWRHELGYMTGWAGIATCLLRLGGAPQPAPWLNPPIMEAPVSPQAPQEF